MNNITDIFSYKKSIKKNIDNDTFLFLFNNSSPLCIAREAITKETELDDGSFFTYQSKILPNLLYSNKCDNTLYKNKFGEWINFTLLSMDYTTSTDLVDIANDKNIYKKYIVSKDNIPEVDFLDSENKTHYIEEHDGETYQPKKVIYIDCNNENVTKITQHSIDSPGITSSTMNHVKNDLKIELLTETAENLVVWLNGVFVEPIYDTNNNKVFYIRDAKNVLDTIGLGVKHEDNLEYENNMSSILYDPENVYYYNIDLRLWKWEDVIVSDKWISVLNTKQSKLYYDYTGYDVVTELFFDEEINPDAHMIFLNGQILHQDEYTIDNTNRKHVYLNKVYMETLILIRELINKGYTNPYMYLKTLIMNRYYHAINLSDTNGKKTLKINHVKPIRSNFPYVNDVMFRNPRMFDIVLVNGSFIPYSVQRNGIYRYPKTVETYTSETLNVEKSFIWKLDICS